MLILHIINKLPQHDTHAGLISILFTYGVFTIKYGAHLFCIYLYLSFLIY